MRRRPDASCLTPLLVLTNVHQLVLSLTALRNLPKAGEQLVALKADCDAF